MADSLSKIKTYTAVDLDNFEIRGARVGINNANTTGLLYTGGSFNNPSKSIITGTVGVNSGNAVLTGISFNPPYSGMDAEDLVIADSVIIDSNIYSITEILSINSVKVNIPVTSTTGSHSASFQLRDREYLIEPDVIINTNRGVAAFTLDSTNVTGFGTQWSTDLRVGDVIQLNTLQQYFMINNISDNTSLQISTAFPLTFSGDTTGNYTAKRWRLNWLNYRYTKNDFTYDKNKAKWIYDATTAGGLLATSYWDNFVDGVQLKFYPSLIPATSPDLMDSNVVLDKLLTRSTENDMPQYSLPAVPNPEESLSLTINGDPKDRFPDGNNDYVINYSQQPTYQYPPPIEDRRVANIMFLNKIYSTSLNSNETSAGTLIFRDGAGNQLAGIMPGSEAILFDGTRQSINQDYVLNIDAGIGYASEHITNEGVVKYVAYPTPNLYDYGLSITLNGVPQKLTIPHSDSDDVIFDIESGRMKPATKDNPGPGEEYIVEYYVEGDYISNLSIQVSPGQTSFRLPNVIKYQSLIITKNDVFLTEWEDYRVGYLTGRVVLFEPLILGDVLVVNYSPLSYQKNGLTFEDQYWYCKSYDVVTPVTGTLEFTLRNSNLSNPLILKAYNVTKGRLYDIANYILRENILKLQANATNISFVTENTDIVQIDYKVQQDNVEYTPVELINFYVGQGSNYIAFINQDVRSIFPAGTFIRLTNVDSAGDYFFRISSNDYDGEDTIVNLDGTIPEDITNPLIYVSDSSVNFTSAPVPASSIQAGATDFYFPGQNYSSEFRIGSLLNVKNDYYYINNSQYDSSAHQTVVSVAVQSYSNYVDSSVLGNIKLSDCPLYYEGDTLISTAKPFITDPATPTMSFNYDGLVTATADSSSLSISTDSSQYSFSYAAHPQISDLSSAMSVIPKLQVTNYCPDWTSARIIPVTNLTITADSSSTININPSLRYFGTDTTKYSFTNGILTLSNPLVRNDRYDLDYLGQESLYDTTVSFSASYFSVLPAKSKIEASFKFDNLDQFYIQATSQRSFLDEVIIPQKKQEALQQSGSIGQGGELPDDGDMQNPDGGIIGDEYRRMDMSIECRVFNKIFDFYNGRAQAFGDEMYAAFGWKLCNNDGLINLTDESCGTRSINRMFPWADYVSMPPYTITPLTGQTIPYAVMGPTHPPSLPVARANFTPGSSIVTCTTPTTYPTLWSKQKPDYIRPYGSTEDSTVSSVINDSTLILTTNYPGSITLDTPFIMTSKFPLYDDDGHVGSKIIGIASDGFGLDNSDIFDVTVDGSHQVYTFLNPIDPYLAQLYPVNSLNAPTIASLITTAFPRLRMTYEWVQDINSPYGYKTVFVLRTKDGYNKMIVGDGSAVSKLGFTKDTTGFGNNNNTDSQPEYYADLQEYYDLGSEIVELTALLSAGGINKLDRVSPSNIARGERIHDYIADSTGGEVLQVATEIDRLQTEISATGEIIQESGMSPYSQTLIAYNNDRTFSATLPLAFTYDQSIATNYQDRTTAARWILNLVHGQQAIRGKDSTGMGVPVSSGTGIIPIIGENSFFIHVDRDGTNDRRILNSTVDGTSYIPYVTFIDSGAKADGTWNGGWDPIVGNQYSDESNNINFLLNDNTPQFVLNYGGTSFSYRSDLTSMTLYWYSNSRSKEYIYSVYPTVGVLKAALNRLAGIDTSGSVVYNSLPSSGIIPTSLTPLSPSVTISDSMYNLFTITADGIYNIFYKVYKTGLGLWWNGSSKFYTYTPSMTVGSLKAEINVDVPGLNATGSPLNDFSSVGFKVTTTTAIPPDASVYPALRECYAHYYSIDSKYLFDRSSFVGSRKDILESRISYLNIRELEIPQHIVADEYFRSIDGSTGNLYNWADNRFNRSVGCEARLKQIEKQVEVNQVSLNVNQRFL